MEIKFVSAKCPDCGANLQIEADRQQAFCTYCGAKVVIYNENEHIFHRIDDAELKQAETERMVQMKRIEFAEKKRIQKEKNKKIKIILSIILGIIGLASIGLAELISFDGLYAVGLFALIILSYMWIGSINGDNDDDDDDFGDKIRLPELSNFTEQSYMAIEIKLRSAGFTNINCVPLNDLRIGLLKKPNNVESISINGKDYTGGRKKYSPDIPIIIAYHSVV